MGDLLRDLQYGARMLWKSKGFTVVAVVSLALGIGFNTTIFSAVDALLLRPKAGLEPESLVEVYLSDSSGYPYGASSYPDFREYRDRTDAFSDIASYQTTLARYQRNGSSEYLMGEIVSGSFFQLVGIRALAGRVLEPSDDVSPGGHPVVAVSERFWRTRLDARREAVGETLELNGRPYTIVGVIPSTFGGGLPGIAMQFWGPASMVDSLNPRRAEGPSRLEQRGSRSLMVKARLAKGVSIEEARAQLEALSLSLQKEYPEDYQGGRSPRILPSSEVRLHPFIDGALYQASSVLMVVVALVLLIACANLANMLLARGMERQGEVALRFALGSSRSRLIRQLLTESVLLSTLGGAAGIFVAYAGSRLLLALKPPIPVPLALDLTLNHRVLGFTLLVSIATGVLFGVAPALQASRSLASALKVSGRRFGLRSALVVVQVALSLVLLIGAGLLLRSASNAQAIDPGFETERVVMLSSHLGLHGYDEPRGRLFYRRAVERLSGAPGIEAAALTGKVPVGGNVETENVTPEGQEPADFADWPEIDTATVSPGYFAVMGVPLIQGRDFDWKDDEGSPTVVIVNETAARRFWPAENPIGKRLVEGKGARRKSAEVIGVVRDTKVRTLGEDPRPHAFWSFSQDYAPMMYVIARARGSADAGLETARRELLAMDSSLAFFEARTMSQNLAITLFPVRAGAVLLGVFGALALLLAAIGLYGAVAYSVSRRTREIGIRMALGAARTDVVTLVTRQSVTVVLTGVALGVCIAAVGSRALASVLYGVGSTDTGVFAGMAAILIAVSTFASFLPARRASSIPPVTALRHE
jgi:putative ABC transport system permease protein